MKAMPQMLLVKVRGKWRFDYRKPETILPQVRSRTALLAALDYYACLYALLRLPRNRMARRDYVERIRPALRWYCRCFRVRAPRWLATDKDFATMSEALRRNLFGAKPLRVREFVKMRRRTSHRSLLASREAG